MSTIDTRPTSIAGVAGDRVPGRAAAVGRAVTSADGKVVGRLFVGTAILLLLGVAAIGALIGIDRLDGERNMIDAGAVPQLFTAFRVGLVYGVLAPLMLGVAVAIVPLQVGARSLAFPRLAAAGFWTWLGGLVLVGIALAGNGGPFGGNEDMVDLFIGGHALAVIGLAGAATSVATTVLTTRAPGMRMRRVPFFSWSALISSLGLLLVLPVFVGTAIYLFVDHRNTRELFDGNAGLGTWLGFGWTSPTTYLFAIPVFGLLAEVVPVTFRKRMPLRGVVLTGLALVGVAALGGVTQQISQDVPWAGSGLDLDGLGDKIKDLVPFALFMLVPILGGLVVIGVSLLAAKPTKDAGLPRITAPFVLAFLGALMVLVGMLGGAISPIVDLGLQGTVFDEGVLVYIVYGTVLAGLGAITYWMPKWSGRLVGDKEVLGLAGLGLIATILASLPLYVAGFADQPADSLDFDYGGPSELWNVAVAAGHALMLLVVLAFLGLVAKALTGPAGDVGNDPWEAHTLEWLTTSPAPLGNFVETPTVMSPEPVYDLRAKPADTAGDKGGTA